MGKIDKYCKKKRRIKSQRFKEMTSKKNKNKKLQEIDKKEKITLMKNREKII